MRLAQGTSIGPYEIVGLLGAGGMGEVYRAHDTRLNRDVALKVLPEALASDPDRLSRFTREAQTLAALNNPHIAHIHGIEETAALRALVMELVIGADLSQLIARGPIALDEALAIARQIAQALEAAHDAGIVHRDLKPANIMVRPDGEVKVLDFGLAKALDPNPTSAASDNSPTLSVHATLAGVLLGTAAYMSPEQARGKAVDKRSDVWAFGCVLYEMLTGRHAFRGDEVADTLALVLTKEPDWAVLPANTPVHIRRVLRRCLEKDRRRRLADIADARLELEDQPGIEAAPAPGPTRRNGIPVSTFVASLLAAAIVGSGAMWLAGVITARPLAGGIVRLDAALPIGHSLSIDTETDDIVISPDGSRLVYRVDAAGAPSRLYVRGLDRVVAAPLEGSEGARNPFFSPDGEWLGFFAPGAIRVMPITGGPSIPICAGCGGGMRGASWGDNGNIVFAESSGVSGLNHVLATGGERQKLAVPDRQADETAYVWPDVLPGSRYVLFAIEGGARTRIALRNLATGVQTTIIPDGTHPRYVPSGHIVYTASAGLRAVRFDSRTLTVTGAPVPLLEPVLTKQTGAAAFSVARNGTLAYAAGVTPTPKRVLVWIDRKGREEPIAAPARTYLYPRLSPDGRRVALDVRDEQRDIWIWDFVADKLTRFTFGGGSESYPAWSPDGRRITFGSEGLLFWAPSDGSGSVEQLTRTSRSDQQPYGFTPDGSKVIVRESGVSLVSVADGASNVLIRGAINAELSPDGKWLAYQMRQTGRHEIFVRPFPRVEQGPWQISTGGGSNPLWARSGRELFFLGPDQALMVVDVQPGNQFSYESPRTLLKNLDVLLDTTGRPYDVSSDGSRFLFIKNAPNVDVSSTGPRLSVVLNWAASLPK